MPRIQILSLPEGTSDDRPPFAVVVDQADSETLHSLAYGVRYDSDHGERPIRDALKEELGARAILVFADTIEIPANNVSAYATPSMVIRIEGDVDSGSADLADQIRRGIEHAQGMYGASA